MNRDQTKDRLGHNGLVNKGAYEPGKGPSHNRDHKSFDATRSTVTNWIHSTPWMHNDLGKKHTYYGRSEMEKDMMRDTMNSLNQSGYRTTAIKSPKANIEDISRKQELIEKINANRREMSSMS